MTVLAYLADAEAGYVRSFRATITALPPGGVVLDRTFFYPTGGGQPSDRGSLQLDAAIVPVVDVVKSGSAVVHRIGRPTTRIPPSGALRVGAEVTGTLDGERRFAHMRAHTAQHLLSARLFARGGVRTRTASIHAGGGQVELEAAWPSTLSLAEVEEDLNAVGQRGLPVHIRHVARAEWESAPDPRSGLVPLPAYLDPVRLIELEGVDRCPCGGTHVRSTSELGTIRLEPVTVPAGPATR
ncbi:MAG: alanyl-tRNA editing protein, partial [Thermoplasmata archaeon]|nr:alanyl-tRNA editing protein [Thermoplasmata archaeon]